jgi:hypothetical protein
MLGQAAIAMWCDIAPQVRSEFEDWHSHEHMPERLSIPGFLRGTRWSDASGEKYFILYELDKPATLTGEAYLERLNDPTPWSRRMMPHHRNMVRSLCAVRASFGGGLPRALATIRFTPSDDPSSLAARLSALPARKGLTGAHLLESQPMPATQTAEQQIRGGDARADWVVLVGGYDADAVTQVACDELRLPGAMVGLYCPAYSLSAGLDRNKGR